jgi:hypothetical protein
MYPRTGVLPYKFNTMSRLLIKVNSHSPSANQPSTLKMP